MNPYWPFGFRKPPAKPEKPLVFVPSQDGESSGEDFISVPWSVPRQPVPFASDSLIPNSISSVINSPSVGTCQPVDTNHVRHPLHTNCTDGRNQLSSMHRCCKWLERLRCVLPLTVAQLPRNHIAVGVMLSPQVLSKPALLTNLHRGVIVAVVVDGIAAGEFASFGLLRWSAICAKAESSCIRSLTPMTPSRRGHQRHADSIGMHCSKLSSQTVPAAQHPGPGQHE